MNNLAWSVLTNVLYLGWTWAQAKAFILANYIPSDSGSQTDAAADMEANKTSGANIVSVAAAAPGARTASWYLLNSPYTTSLPVIAQGGAPDASGALGDVLTATSAGPVWTPAAAGGLTGVGAFGSAPTANGATVSGSNLVLQPADGTHPGAVSAAAQTLGGAKTFAAGVAVNGAAPAATGVGIGTTSGGVGLWFSQATPSGSNYAFAEFAGFGTYINSPASEPVNLASANTIMVQVSPTLKTIDATGLGTGGSIKLQSPDGTTYTLSIANGGTVHIV